MLTRRNREDQNARKDASAWVAGTYALEDYGLFDEEMPLFAHIDARKGFEEGYRAGLRARLYSRELLERSSKSRQY